MYETIYLACAIVGGTLLVCQFLLGLLGVGEHHDAGGDHDFHDSSGHDAHGADDAHEGQQAWFVGLLTFRSVVAALAIFGLTGLASLLNFGHEPAASLGLALGGGALALFGVSYMMRALHGLKSDGTVRIDRAIGQSATVYLTIPGQKVGVGKVTLRLQNRTVEYQAVTAHHQLPTGSKVVVTAVLGSDTVEVAPTDQPALAPSPVGNETQNLTRPS